MFQVAKDWFTDQWLSQQLLTQVAWIIVLLAVVFAGFHLLRRGLGAPLRTNAGDPPPPGVGRVERFEIGARLYHWGNLVFFLLLIVSGLALFAPGWLSSPGISWLLVHEIGAGLFIAGLLLHIWFSFWRADPSTMWFAKGDAQEFRHTLQYYAGRRRDLPKTGKYDVWQKIYHGFLTLLAIAAIFTGTSLFLNAELLTDLGHRWMRWQRLVHDVTAFLFISVIVGHCYVRLVKLNWPKLVSMFTGSISRQHFKDAHDWRRWQPPAETSRTGNDVRQARSRHHGRG